MKQERVVISELVESYKKENSLILEGFGLSAL